MDFSEALKLIKDGGRLCRSIWNNTDFRKTYVYYELASNVINQTTYYESTKPEEEPRFNTIPYFASMRDILATDWVIYDEK